MTILYSYTIYFDHLPPLLIPSYFLWSSSSEKASLFYFIKSHWVSLGVLTLVWVWDYFLERGQLLIAAPLKKNA